MRKVKVKAGQCLTDIALQEYGSTDAMLAIARQNALTGIDADLFPGQELVIDDTLVFDPDTSRFMRQLAGEGVFVATAIEAETPAEIPDGIGYDSIAIDNDIA